MNRTFIDYLGYTWNPLAMRCTQVSPACDNCWHLRMAVRKAGNPKLSYLERLASAGLIPPVLMPDRLDEPLRLKKPRRIGVQFMGDLFHEAVGDLDIYQIFDVMARCQNQTFVCLTKRPQRMLDFCRRLRFIPTTELAHLTEPGVSYNPNGPVNDPLPLPNVWLGVTAENQEWFDRRWAYLKQVPAAKIVVSYEPALGPIVLPEDFLARGNDAWLVAGGETGPRARPSHPAWFLQARDQAVAVAVPFFFKSWGKWIPFTSWNCACNQKGWGIRKDLRVLWPNGISGSAVMGGKEETWDQGCRAFMSFRGDSFFRRLLDGRTWDEVPTL